MKESTQPLNALTGLRWIAAAAVFVHHMNLQFSLAKAEIWLGSLAVSFFFVLSGFILTYVYAERLKKPGDGVRKFWLTRWARIWPLHFVCLLIFITAMIGWRRTFTDGTQVAQFFTNMALVQSWVPQHDWVFSFNSVSWSISTESFFYFMFPFLLIGGERKFWFKFLGVGLVVGALVYWFSRLSLMPEYNAQYNFDRVFLTNPLLRLPEFCSGMAVGYCFLKRRNPNRQRNFWRDTIVELIVVGLFLGWDYLLRHMNVANQIRTASWGSNGLSQWMMLLLAVWTFAILIYVFAQSHGLLGRIMGSRLMVFLGEVSFAFYMIHNIVILYFKQNYMQHTTLSPYLLGLCAFCVSLALSILLFKLIEMPAKAALLALVDRRFGDAARFVKTGVVSFVATPAALCALLLIAVPVSAMSLNRYSVNLTENVEEIVSATPAAQREVRFGGQVTLLGYRAIATETHLEIEMIWLKGTKLEHHRYLHLCDSEGKIIGHGPLNDPAFESAELNVPFGDRVVLPLSKFSGVSYIGVGFYGEKTMLEADHGPRSMGLFRLNLLTPKQLSEVLHKDQ